MYMAKSQYRQFSRYNIQQDGGGVIIPIGKGFKKGENLAKENKNLKRGKRCCFILVH